MRQRGAARCGDPAGARSCGARSVDRDLRRLAWPALGALVAEPLYVLTDTAIVGHLGTAPLGGLAIASAVLLTGYSVCVFLAYGTTAAVSRLLGAGRHSEAAVQAVQGLWLAGGLGAALAVAGFAARGPLIAALGGRGEIAEQAEIYLRISLLGLPALLVSLAGIGYLRGLQDTTTPLVVAAVTAVGNGVVEWVLIFGLGFGIGASALSTVVAQAVTAAVFLHRILRNARRLGVSLTPDTAAIARLLVVGSHLVVRTAALRGSLLVGVAVAARIGPEDLAAYEIAFQVWSLGALALDAVAIAAQALVARALGAGTTKGARLIARRALWWGTVSGVGLGVVLAAASPWLGNLFTNDPAVVELAAFSFLVVAAVQPLNGAVFALDGILIGAGDQRFLAWAMAGAFALFLPGALAVRFTGAGLGWLWAVLAVFMAARGAALAARLRSDRWTVTGAVR